MFGCKGSMLCVYASPFQLFDMFRSTKLKYLHRYFSLRTNVSEKVIRDVTMLPSHNFTVKVFQCSDICGQCFILTCARFALLQENSC